MPFDQHLLTSTTSCPPSYRSNVDDPMSLIFIDSTHKWDHAVFVFLCLVYFSEYNWTLQFHPCCHKWQEFLLLWLNSIPLSKYTKHFLHPLICQQTCWLLPYFTIWIMLQKTWEGRQFFEVPISFVWDIPWSGVAGWCGSPISISSNF